MAAEKQKVQTKPERQGLAAKVYNLLRERIMDFEFAPDNRINIDALAEQMNVSPTPVREALSRLAAEGLVDFASYKGYTVRPPLTSRELAEFIHVRKLLEADAARLAASRMSLFDLNAIGRILQEMQDMRPSSKFREYGVFNHFDQQLHEAIVAAAGNIFLMRNYQSLNVHVHLARYYRARKEADISRTMNEHQTIYETLKARDGEAAAQALITHIDNAYLRAINSVDE